jgi:adenylate kinase family enzyme
MDAGKLVPDEIIIAIVKEFLDKDEYKRAISRRACQGLWFRRKC